MKTNWTEIRKKNKNKTQTCSTFVEDLAEVSKKGIPNCSAYSYKTQYYFILAKLKSCNCPKKWVCLNIFDQSKKIMNQLLQRSVQLLFSWLSRIYFQPAAYLHSRKHNDLFLVATASHYWRIPAKKYNH